MIEDEEFKDLEQRLLSLKPIEVSTDLKNRLASIGEESCESNRVVIATKESKKWAWSIGLCLAATVLIFVGVIVSLPSNKNREPDVVTMDLKVDIQVDHQPTILNYNVVYRKDGDLSALWRKQSAMLLPDFPLDRNKLYGE